MAPAAAMQLARLLATRRLQTDAALSLDGYARWGGNSNYGPNKAEHEAMVAARPGTGQQLTALVATLRATDPEALTYWIDGQIRLLDAFLATDPSDSTASFVAHREREGWEGVRAGDQAFVDQNTAFITQDSALFESIFGFSPYRPNED